MKKRVWGVGERKEDEQDEVRGQEGNGRKIGDSREEERERSGRVFSDKKGILMFS